MTECLVVARVVHEHHVIRPNEVAAHEIDGAADAVGEQDLVRAGIDTEVLQSASHILAQRGVSSQIAVAADEAAAHLTRHVAHGPIQAALLEPLRGQPAAAGDVPVLELMALLANQPEYVGGLLQPQPAIDP